MKERSFAGELASLLGPTAPSHEIPNAAVAAHGRAIETMPEIADIGPAISVSRVLENAGHADIADTTGSAEGIDVAAAGESTDRGTSGRFLNNANDDENASGFQPIVVRAARTSTDRIAPLTRLPLRPHTHEITWYAPLEEAATLSKVERHTLLERAAQDRGGADIGTLTQAYHEEDAQGRILALLALASHRASETQGTFVDALHNGTDDERLVAVDALATLDARDELPAAFNDRVDAIAARAALAYVGSNVREAYRNALEPHVDPVRIETILALLAGFVE